MSLVLDSSVTLSWYFEDERTEASKAVLDQVASHGAVAPSLWRLEVANSLAVAIRRKRVTPAYRDASLVDLATMAISIDPDADSHVWSTTVKLADQHRLTMYDAVYLDPTSTLSIFGGAQPVENSEAAAPNRESVVPRRILFYG